MARRVERRALWIGVVGSLVVHVLVALLNPVFRGGELPRREREVRVEHAGRLVPLAALREVAAGEAHQPAMTSQPTSRPPRDVAPADSAGPSGPAAEAAAVRGAERLRYRPGSVWAVPPLEYETVEECRQRELQERLAKGIADAGPIPRGGSGATPPRSLDVGVRIPVGRKPPPPPQGLPPPPIPDSLRAVRGGAYVPPKPPPPLRERRPAGCPDTIPPPLPRRPH